MKIPCEDGHKKNRNGKDLTEEDEIKKNKWELWQTLFSWAAKSLWMGTTAMKLKDVCSLEKKI